MDLRRAGHAQALAFPQFMGIVQMILAHITGAIFATVLGEPSDERDYHNGIHFHGDSLVSGCFSRMTSVQY